MNEETNEEKVERIFNEATCLGFWVMHEARNTPPEDRDVAEHMFDWLKTLPKAERKKNLLSDTLFLKQLGIKPVRLGGASRKKGGQQS